MKLDPGFGWKYSDYRKSLELFSKNDYAITSFKQFLEAPSKKHLILRHDVDFNLDAAYKMAQIDYQLGIRSTFFLRVCANGYNLSSTPSIKIIKELINMGHELGLHLDTGMENIWSCSLNESIERQFKIFESATGVKAKGFSVHMPATLGGIDYSSIIIENFDLLYHAYERQFTEGEFKYISDSMKMWREKPLIEFINDVNKIQLLIHPIWWYESNPQEHY
jgi:hypothetical protein